MMRTRGRTIGRRERIGYCLFLALMPGLALLSGCAVGPDYAPPSIELPAHWANASASRRNKQITLAQWWRRLNDRLLTTLIEEAVRGNLDVATAKAKIREARAVRSQAIGALFPSSTGSASATRSQIGVTGGSSSGSAGASGTTSDSASLGGASGGAASAGSAATTYNQFQTGFDASWELDLFGANRRAVEAATYGVDAAEDELRATLLTLIGDVASYYTDARGYQARIALAQRSTASQRKTAALTKSKFEAGSASAVDVAKAVAQAETTAANIPTYEQGFAEAVHRLSVLLGREPSALSHTLRRSAPVPHPRFPLPLGIPADVLMKRPDVRKAERQLGQYTAKIGQAEAALYPSVSLTGSMSTGGLKIGDLAKASAISWSIGPSLTVPIFDGGQLRAAVDITRAQRDQYYVAWQSSVLTALEEVENALVSLAQERIKARRLSAAARGYRDAAQLSRTLFETGTTSFLDVLDTERSLYSAEDSLIESRVATTKDYIALAKALGGGWDGMIDTARPEVIDLNTGPHIPR